jgi:rhodanese-related sulfurtransferase
MVMFNLFKRTGTAIAAMTPEELALALAGDGAPVIVDVRSSEEYAQGHLPGAINIPMTELDARAATLDPDVSTVFY